MDLGHHNRWALSKSGKGAYQRYQKSKSTLTDAERAVIRNRMIEEGTVEGSIAQLISPETSLMNQHSGNPNNGKLAGYVDKIEDQNKFLRPKLQKVKPIKRKHVQRV